LVSVLLKKEEVTMPYTTFLGEKFEDEHDEELTRKFGDTYKYFKRQYPDLYKLPTEEVRGIFHEFNKSPYGDTFEKSLDRTRQYIDRRMPDWQEQYINPKAQQSDQQESVWDQANKRKIENDLLMDGLDTMYGMNRTINGMTFGGLDWLGDKLGFDSKMNDYLNLKDEQNRNLTQLAGHTAELGGAALTGGTLAKAGYDQANMVYNGYKIGKQYDKLSINPYQGKGSDVIARMKNHKGDPVILQRGEAIRGENGEVIVYGKNLRREAGTERNYGLDKIIYKHEMPRNEVTRIPRYIKQNDPVEISQRGQNIYAIQRPCGEIRIATTPQKGYHTIATMYIKE